MNRLLILLLTLALPAGAAEKLIENARLTGTTNVPNGATLTVGGTFNAPASFTLGWSKLTSVPTTLAGFGIADAQPLTADLTAFVNNASWSGGNLTLSGSLSVLGGLNGYAGLGTTNVFDGPNNFRNVLTLGWLGEIDGTLEFIGLGFSTTLSQSLGGTANHALFLPDEDGTLISTGGNGTVTNTMLAGAIPATKLVGTDIDTVGSITTGSWRATPVNALYGGMGVANPVNATFSFSGNVVFGSSNHTFSIATTGNTSLNAPTSGTLLTTTGSGVSLTALNATQLTSGTVPDARFPATLPAASGVNLTALNATQLTSGTVPNARFPATLPAASGVNLTALNATQLTSGTVPDARFPATLPAASGVNLTALNASNIASGTLAIARGGTAATVLTGTSGALAKLGIHAPAFAFWRDDFNGGLATATGGIGELGWRIENITGLGGTTFQQSGGAADPSNHPGQLKIFTGAVTGDATGVSLGMQAGTWRAWSDATFEMYWVIQLDQDTNVAVWAGLWWDNTAANANNGIWAKFDTSAGDTQWELENKSSGTSTQPGTGISGTVGIVFHTIKARGDGTGTIYLSIDGGGEVSCAGAPTNQLFPMIAVQTKAMAAKSIHVDFFGTGLNVTR